MDLPGADLDNLSARALELLRYVGHKALQPALYPISSQQRIYWLYMVTALLLAILVFVAQRGPGGLRALPRFLVPRGVYTHASAVVDYKFFFINRFLFVAFIAPLLLTHEPISNATASALTSLRGVTVGAPATFADRVAFTLCVVVAMDFGLYVAHYLQHRVAFLWEFHKTHHSAQVLTPMSVYRMHPMDDVLSGLCAVAMVGLARGVFKFMFGTVPAELGTMSLNIVTFAFYVGGYNLRHSHIWLSYPRWLSHILISPAQHQIHHSTAPRHYDKNMGFIFAIWDAAFGTLYAPRQREDLEFGLSDKEHLALNSVWQLYTRPFRMLAARFSPADRSAT